MTKAFDESQHPRKPAGTPAGGEFTSGAGHMDTLKTQVVQTIRAHHGSVSGSTEDKKSVTYPADVDKGGAQGFVRALEGMGVPAQNIQSYSPKIDRQGRSVTPFTVKVRKP